MEQRRSVASLDESFVSAVSGESKYFDTIEEFEPREYRLKDKSLIVVGRYGFMHMSACAVHNARPQCYFEWSDIEWFEFDPNGRHVEIHLWEPYVPNRCGGHCQNSPRISLPDDKKVGKKYAKKVGKKFKKGKKAQEKGSKKYKIKFGERDDCTDFMVAIYELGHFLYKHRRIQRKHKYEWPYHIMFRDEKPGKIERFFNDFWTFLFPK